MDKRHKNSNITSNITGNTTSLPDYIGLWTEGPFQGNSFKGKFRIYINERSPLNDNYELIKGILEDEFGKASLEGAISPSEILFHAKYIDDYLKNYKDFEIKYYAGKSIKSDVYKGTYGFKEDKSDEITYYPTLKFIMKKFNPALVELLENRLSDKTK